AMLPQIADRVTARRQPELRPTQRERPPARLHIECSHIPTSGGIRPRYPDDESVAGESLVGIGGVLIHGDHLGIPQETRGPAISTGEIAAHEKGRARDAPQGE